MDCSLTPYSIEWCFVVRCFGGYGEIRVRDNGEVVHTAGSLKWCLLDGISFPTEDSKPARVERNDIIDIIADENFDATPLGEKAFLFHYTKFSTALDFILKNRSIKMGAYSNTNDPRENKEWLFTLVSSEPQAPEGSAIKVSQKLSRAIQNRARILCFSNSSVGWITGQATELSQTDGWAHSRMWAQYAEDHSGVVLVLDRRKLLENARRALALKGQLTFGRVLYVDGSHPADQIPFTIKYNEWLKVGEEQYARRHIRKHRDWLFFTKQFDWIHEREARLLFLAPGEEDVFVPLDGALVEICAGDGTDDSQLNRLKQASARLGCSLSRVFWRNGYPIRCPFDQLRGRKLILAPSNANA